MSVTLRCEGDFFHPRIDYSKKVDDVYVRIDGNDKIVIKGVPPHIGHENDQYGISKFDAHKIFFYQKNDPSVDGYIHRYTGEFAWIRSEIVNGSKRLTPEMQLHGKCKPAKKMF
jgi:hypothetical protein